MEQHTLADHADHVEIRKLIVQLRGDHIDAAIARLAVLLPIHFAEEEKAGGFFERLEQRGLTSEVADLRLQHGAMLARIEALDHFEPPDRHEASAALAATLEQHEWEENCLAAGSTDDPPLEPKLVLPD